MKNVNLQSAWFSRGTDGHKFKIQKPTVLCSPYKQQATEENQKNSTFLQRTPNMLSEKNDGKFY